MDVRASGRLLQSACPGYLCRAFFLSSAFIIPRSSRSLTFYPKELFKEKNSILFRILIHKKLSKAGMEIRNMGQRMINKFDISSLNLIQFVVILIRLNWKYYCVISD